ncbi:sorbose reductase sou1 [Fomitopsis betulina]|nr:sorbose reductase sou1 [Fomitopsis betulina]
MHTSRLRQLPRALLPAARSPFGHTSQRVARFSTTVSRHSIQNPPLNTEKTGIPPPYAPVGVAAALEASPHITPTPTIFEHEFSLKDRVALVSGANRGLGLEMSMALAEAGARAVYCVDLPKEPSDEWCKVKDYLARMKGKAGEGRLEYLSADVRDQEHMWKIGQTIGDREGRLDVGIAAAGILNPDTDCLEYDSKAFEKVMETNVNGSLFTAQAAARQMVRFGNGGSIILIASLSGSVTNRGYRWISYNTSKSAILQMTRSMACELGPKRIRVNSLSPGHIYTTMTAAYFDTDPRRLEIAADSNPLNRLGRPDELRGVVTWLASDASTFCTGSDMLVTGGHHAW